MLRSTRALSLALRLHGLQRYARRFEQADLPAAMLHSLTNAELREDFHIASLAHRRKILRLLRPPPQSRMLPFFGEILVHLSNVRTFHSWLRSAFQLVIFSFATATLGTLRAAPAVDALSLATAALSTLFAGYGAFRYFTVLRRARRKTQFQADRAGALLAALLSFTAAASTLSLLLLPRA